MKTYLFFFLFLLTTLTGCKENPVTISKSKYNGSWLWMQSVGGFLGRVILPEEGEVIIIMYDEFNTYKLFKNDTLKVFATYAVEESKNGVDKISYSNHVKFDYYFDEHPEYADIRSDTLVLWDGYYDGYFSYYKKVNK